jgi:hypothetical protein
MRWRAGLTTERPAGMGMDDRAKASWAQSSAAPGPPGSGGAGKRVCEPQRSSVRVVEGRRKGRGG